MIETVAETMTATNATNQNALGPTLRLNSDGSLPSAHEEPDEVGLLVDAGLSHLILDVGSE
jgi:hypothetical protein